MTNSNTAIREIAEKTFPLDTGELYNSLQRLCRSELIERITALISEHYVSREEHEKMKHNLTHCGSCGDPLSRDCPRCKHLYLTELPLPPAEGAEEILDAKEIYLDLCFKNILFEDRLKLVVMAMEKYATLHAQRLAEKMVSERLREELIAYDKWVGEKYIDNYRHEIAPAIVDEYLKSRKK